MSVPVDEGRGWVGGVGVCVCSQTFRAKRSGGACVAAALAQHRSLVTAAGSAHLKHVQAVFSEAQKGPPRSFVMCMCEVQGRVDYLKRILRCVCVCVLGFSLATPRAPNPPFPHAAVPTQHQ